MGNKTRKYYEHLKRSLAKAITFRIVVMLADYFIISSITQRPDLALGVIIASNVSSTILYFMHERVWNNIHWGKEK